MNSFCAALHQFDLEDLAQRYRRAQPFPHLALDGFLPVEQATSLEQQCRAAVAPLDSSNAFTQKDKFTLNDWALMPEAMRQACAFFQSGTFLAFLQTVTGLQGLIADPWLEGGGLHRTLTGGYLKLHTDFNWNPRLRLFRRINVLYYLNSGYQQDWGGELLLTRHPSQPHGPVLSESESHGVALIEPRFNRLVLFNTNDTTFHGHPRPHRFPAGFPRTSLAFYYYTVASPPWSERRRLRTATTRYVLAPDDPVQQQPVPLRRRLGYWLRRWTPLG